MTSIEQGNTDHQLGEVIKESVNNNKPNKFVGVKGWLLLFCIILTIIVPLGSFFNLYAGWIDTYEYFDEISGLNTFVYADSLLSILLVLLSVRAGIALWKIKPRAIIITRNYLLIFLGYTILSTQFLANISGLSDDIIESMRPEMQKLLIDGVVFFAIWYSYLGFSRRVKATYYD